MARAALFDMDRTLVSVNSGRLYVGWRFKRREASLRDSLRAMRYLLQYSVGAIDAAVVAERTLHAFKGYDEQRMSEECQQWYEEVVRPYVTDIARREVERCRTQGMVVAILSAQTRYATEPLAADLGIDHILCSKLHVEEGRFTGGFERPLCYGPGKITHARHWAEANAVDLERSSFYSDSISDLPMLEVVGEPRVINPDPRLRLAALVRGWPVERWK
jgi:HAD superfamily hydrolase (TIGR01490 family)